MQTLLNIIGDIVVISAITTCLIALWSLAPRRIRQRQQHMRVKVT
jgi:hypothetical protein